MAVKRRKLGELLLAARVLDESQLQAALAEQKRWGGKLGRTLIDLGYVREDIMVKALSHQMQLPSVDLQKKPPPAAITAHLPVHLCERYGVFPLVFDPARKALTVATSDPTNDSALRDLRMELNVREIHPVVAGAHDIDRAIRHHYYGEEMNTSPTAIPQQFGVHEQMVDLDHPLPTNGFARPSDRPKPAPATAFTSANRLATAHAPSAEPPAAVPPLEQLAASVQWLEKLLSAEVRSLRCLVELLVEKGLVSREEFLEKTKGPVK